MGQFYAVHSKGRSSVYPKQQPSWGPAGEAYLCEWEDMAARDLGLRTCAALPLVGCPTGDFPCSGRRLQEHHREKLAKVTKFINAMVSRPVGRAEMLSNTKAMDSMRKEWKDMIDQGVSIYL